MRKAGRASGRAFTEAMKHSFSSEAELYAFLEYQFRVKGCDKSAFVPVVAGGKVRQRCDEIYCQCAQLIYYRTRLVFITFGMTMCSGTFQGCISGDGCSLKQRWRFYPGRWRRRKYKLFVRFMPTHVYLTLIRCTVDMRRTSQEHGRAMANSLPPRGIYTPPS